MAHIPRHFGPTTIVINGPFRVLIVQMQASDCTIVLGQPPQDCDCGPLPPGVEDFESEPRPDFVPIAIMTVSQDEGYRIQAAWREGGVVTYDLRSSVIAKAE